MSYGTYKYGQQPYGWTGQDAEGAQEVTGFRVVLAVATSYTTVRIEYSEAPKITDVTVLISQYGKGAYSKQPYGKLYQDTATLIQKSALDVDNYAIITDPASPEAGTITIESIRALSDTAFELTVSNMVSEINYTLIASEYIANLAGTTTLGQTVALIGFGNEVEFVGFGIQPRIVSVTNPSEGQLVVVFSESMTINFAFRNLSSYLVAPIAGGPFIYLSGITVDEATPDRVQLSFIGGGGQYSIVAHGITDLDGVYITQRPFYFTIAKHTRDELFDTTDYYFETNLGAIRLSVGTLSARRIEDFAILKTQDTGYEIQFQNIAKALENAGIAEQDRVLKLFKR